jgi:hypothetical protein
VQGSFLETRDSLIGRPCAIDDVSRTIDRLAGHRYKKAMLFVDNAGSDVVLGTVEGQAEG